MNLCRRVAVFLAGDPEDFVTGRSRYWREAWRRFGRDLPVPVKRSRVRRFLTRVAILLFSWPVFGQSIVQLPVLPSGFACGAVKRSADEIQPYCYGQFNGARRLVTNSLIVVTTSAGIPTTDFYTEWGPGPKPLPDGTVPVPTCGVDVDCILWSFQLLATGEIQYSVALNKGTPMTGKLVGIYGQPAAVVILNGTRDAAGVCKLALNPVPVITPGTLDRDDLGKLVHPGSVLVAGVPNCHV